MENQVKRYMHTNGKMLERICQEYLSLYRIPVPIISRNYTKLEMIAELALQVYTAERKNSAKKLPPATIELWASCVLV